MSTTIITASGQEYDLAAPRPGAVIVADIAHALAQIPRFNGHARRPYSVAEHSLLCAEIAERELGLGIDGQLACLIHDAHEAFVSDLATPAKKLVGVGWLYHETRHEAHVSRCLGMHSTLAHYSPAVKQADLMALATERRDLMPPGPAWPQLEGIEPIGWVRLHSAERAAMAWTDWRQAWLDRYHELEYGRLEASR